MTSKAPFRHKRCMILFVRAPQIGRVKTRLEKALGPEVVLQLYKCFTKDVIETAKEGVDRIRICYYPSNQKALVMNWLGEGFDYFPQNGADLGERMKNAFLNSFKAGFTQAVLIGTDLPDLPGAILEEAFSALGEGKPVIGPAKDGGYFLIGFERDRFYPSIFDNMVWGRDDVFQKTCAAFEKTGHPPHTVSEWQDIDEHKDLLDLVDRLKTMMSEASHTLRYLKKIGLA